MERHQNEIFSTCTKLELHSEGDAYTLTEHIFFKYVTPIRWGWGDSPRTQCALAAGLMLWVRSQHAESQGFQDTQYPDVAKGTRRWCGQ